MKIKVTLLLIGSVIFACLCTVLIDRLVIRYWADSIAIPRATRMIYDTPEFHYTVDANSMGFRDREFSVEADPAVIKIAVLGDSFTYGWGVAEEESWPRILENMLRQKGYPAVVLNLGKPGHFPFVYAGFAQQYIPILKPDIVLVGVLQGDDLCQMEYGDCSELTQSSEQSACSPPKKVVQDAPAKQTRLYSIRAYLKTALRILYPQTMRARSYRSRTQSEHLSTIWKRMAEEARSHFSPKETKRFIQLDGQIRDMFLRGNLNPTLVQMAVINPDLFVAMSSFDSARTSDLIQRMSQCLLIINQTGRNCGTRGTAVLSIPYGIYTCKKSWLSRSRIGFNLTPEMLTDNKADTAIGMACEKAGIPCISVTEDFRRHAAEQDLFYTYDGHFNTQGHAVYAELIAPAIIDMINQNKLIDNF